MLGRLWGGSSSVRLVIVCVWPLTSYSPCVSFDVEAFVSDPSLIVFDRCKKNDLRVIAEHYSVPVSSSLVKAELKAVL